MPLNIIRNDITRVKADAIVNTANPEPRYGSGTDCAIYKAAGEEKLLAERRKIGEIRSGEVAVTPAFALPATYIIHTVGPVWLGGKGREYELLASCYKKSLLIARQLGCKSIAFPLISAGNYGFPKDRALSVALKTIGDFLYEDEDDMKVTLVVFERSAFELSASLLTDIEQFIDENYVEAKKASQEYGDFVYERRAEAYIENRSFDGERDERISRRRRLLKGGRDRSYGAPIPLEEAAPVLKEPDAPKKAKRSDFWKEEAKAETAAPGSLDDLLRSKAETFQEALLRMIDERGLKDSEVYKRANLDRKLFSKIRCNADYTPKKNTALALAVALELNKDQAMDLLRRAGMTFSPSSKTDLIVEYCLEHRNYDIYQINALLFEYKQPVLGK